MPKAFSWFLWTVKIKYHNLDAPMLGISIRVFIISFNVNWFSSVHSKGSVLPCFKRVYKSWGFKKKFGVQFLKYPANVQNPLGCFSVFFRIKKANIYFILSRLIKNPSFDIRWPKYIVCFRWNGRFSFEPCVPLKLTVVINKFPLLWMLPIPWTEK